MGLTAYISLYLSILFFLLTWFTPKPPCLYLNHFNLCLQPQEPVYVSLPLDTSFLCVPVLSELHFQ